MEIRRSNLKKLMAVIQIAKFILELVLFIILLPILIVALLFRLWHFRRVLAKSMVKSGMPEEYAKQLAKETRIISLMK